jgi:hypothetical protein
LEGPDDGKNIFFLDAPAGSGKTYVTELMIQALRFKGRLVIPIASTDMAVLLLEKGMTAHKCFSIPLQQERSCTPSVSVAFNPRPQMMDAFQDCDIIFWNEITTSPLSIISGVDNLMRKAKSVSNKPFGSIAMRLLNNCILTPNNAQVRMVNSMLLETVSGQDMIFEASDEPGRGLQLN